MSFLKFRVNRREIHGTGCWNPTEQFDANFEIEIFYFGLWHQSLHGKAPNQRKWLSCWSSSVKNKTTVMGTGNVVSFSEEKAVLACHALWHHFYSPFPLRTYISRVVAQIWMLLWSSVVVMSQRNEKLGIFFFFC